MIKTCKLSVAFIQRLLLSTLVGPVLKDPCNNFHTFLVLRTGLLLFTYRTYRNISFVLYFHKYFERAK